MEIFRPGTVGPWTGLGLKTEPGRVMLQKLQWVQLRLQHRRLQPADRPAESGTAVRCSQMQSGPTGPLMQSFPLAFCFLLCLRLLCWFYMAFRCGLAHGRVRWVGEMNFCNFSCSSKLGYKENHIARVIRRDWFLFSHCAQSSHPSNRAGDVTSHTETWTTQIGVGCHDKVGDKEMLLEVNIKQFLDNSNKNLFHKLY